LNQAGKEVDPGTALQILQRLHTYDWNFKEFDDSIPTLQALKQRNITIGLISNVARDMEDVYRELGLDPYLDFKVTSLEVGYDKPDPRIFNAALEKAGCLPDEVIYVGDQYEQDILGARGVGMGAVLIDRNNWFSGSEDMQRIESLGEILTYI
jgi:putative hydrolase of the HAD superfamily